MYHANKYNEYLVSSKKQVQRKVGFLPLSQEQFEFCLTQLIVYAMLPLSIVTIDAFKYYTHSEHFLNMVFFFKIIKYSHRICFFFRYIVITTGFADPGDGIHYRIVSPPTICKNIDRYYELEKENFINQLRDILYVCVTSDIWATPHTSFMGITIHWVDQTTMKMVSKLLCCPHFMSPHTGTRIAALLHDIFEEYGISQKVNVLLMHIVA